MTSSLSDLLVSEWCRVTGLAFNVISAYFTSTVHVKTGQLTKTWLLIKCVRGRLAPPLPSTRINMLAERIRGSASIAWDTGWSAAIVGERRTKQDGKASSGQLLLRISGLASPARSAQCWGTELIQPRWELLERSKKLQSMPTCHLGNLKVVLSLFWKAGSNFLSSVSAGNNVFNPKEDTFRQNKILALLLSKSLVPVEKDDPLGERSTHRLN